MDGITLTLATGHGDAIRCTVSMRPADTGGDPQEDRCRTSRRAYNDLVNSLLATQTPNTTTPSKTAGALQGDSAASSGIQLAVAHGCWAA